MNEYNETEHYTDGVRQRMEEMETAELERIWRENDRSAWTNEAFAAVRAILMQRLGELPEQEEEIDEEDEVIEVDEDERLVVPYPQDKKLIWIADVSNRLSGVVLVVGIVATLVRMVTSMSLLYSSASITSWFFEISRAAITVLVFIVVYVVMQAITEIIYLMLDIRELSRPALEATGDGAVEP